GEPDARVADSRSAATTFRVADILHGLAATTSTTQLFLADPASDVTPSGPGSKVPDNSPATLQPLARVFGQQAFNPGPTRHYRISSTLAGARADTLSAVLDKDLGTMGSADRGLFFYAGSGGPDTTDAADNTLRLWDNTGLSVRNLEALTSHVPVNAPMRFVLTQCHSSGFQRLIRPGARDQRSLGRYNRCVFTSEPIDHLAQRCPAGSTEGSEDRDYATRFFSALSSSRTRTGSGLPRSADLDGDHVVTLHEAHLYAVLEGDSAELPRASTETYLERWQPVWLRYLDTISEPDNEFGRVSRALAERLRLPLHGRALVDALETRQKDMTGRLKRLAEESQQVGAEIDRLQATLRRGLTQRWPAAAHPYTAAYARFLANDVGVAQSFLVAQSTTYPALVAKQDRLAQIALDRHALDRSLTQLDKLMRLRHLARLQAQFERYADAQARQEYARLEHCERTPL
ncbi:hypothetical protein, partial [Sphaerotilus sp.]|uniref:hypothetical protein n=1 Tax=Sphaerotilus sp. TaxID=2093942 RepID=UPI0034E2824A